MTQKEIPFSLSTYLAILNANDTELKEVFLEGFRLIQSCPEILNRINRDIDEVAKQKKKIRQEDAAWYWAQNMIIPGLDFTYQPAENIMLFQGRPRKMNAETTFFMMLVRGHLSSVTSKKAKDRINDSELINKFFSSYGWFLPSTTTIHDYLQAITSETRQYIFEQGLNSILSDGLDSMESLTIDSFAVAANSKWPTDSRTMQSLLFRACTLGLRLSQWGLPGLTKGYFFEWLDELRRLDFKMALTAGKSRSKGKVKKLYRLFLKRVDKILSRFISQYTECLPKWRRLDLAPSNMRKVNQTIDQMESDIHAVIKIYTYAEDRVFHNITLSASEKILSLSDTTAAFIKKGQREPVIGYKPQVGRTGNGFISIFEVIPGNPADSSRLKSLVEGHITMTGVEPKVISLDDGYSSKVIRIDLCKNESVVVSMSGSKGKKITPEELWNSENYQNARSNRSAVESLIFTLRYKFDLWRFSRRGIDGVRSELTEKIIVHNLWRAAYLKSRQKQAA